MACGPESSARPGALDLFAGAGGLSLGFEQAGFDVLGAVELDPIHAAVHSFNFPQCRTLCGNAAALRGEDIQKRLPGPVDVIVGGAPCQGFSLIGQRALDDPRNALVKHFLRLVVELEPSVFVLENVRGITVGRHRRILDELVDAFQDAGYAVTLPWQVLNARDYGVPQDRQRLFLMGAKGVPAPDYPALDLGAPQYTCRDALDDLPNAEDFEALLDSDAVSVPAPTDGLGAYAREMRCLSDDAWHYGHPRDWNPDRLTASLRTDHTDLSRRRFRDAPPGAVEPTSRLRKLAAAGVANTLRAGTDSARGAFTAPRPIHYRHPRCVTVREMARLHGIPDWFRLHVTKWHGARQVGNAVPPPLARAVAGAVRRALGFEPTRPEKALSLGRPDLLRMGMAEASAHWGVDVPIAQRDRRSGGGKRRQGGIEGGPAPGEA